MDGRPAMLRNGHQQSAPNVIVQYVNVRSSKYVDVSGAHSPYTTTTGTGKAVLFRDGKAIRGATGKKYLLTRADRGHRIRLKLVGSKDGFTTVTKYSAYSTRIR